MLEILQFTFSSFWIWAGTFFLVVAIGASLGGLVKIVINRKKVNSLIGRDNMDKIIFGLFGLNFIVCLYLAISSGELGWMAATVGWVAAVLNQLLIAFYYESPNNNTSS